MSKRLFKTLVAVLAIAAAAAGPVRGQNASPDVTLDFTTNTWGLPTTGTNHGPEEYSNGTYSITLYTPISGTNTYKFNNSYLLLGRSGAYLELPSFGSPVEKIEVVGNSQASAYVNQNIYVGETAVSTQTTGATGTNTYVINENYRAAGNIYTLKVESSANTQITYIKVYYASGGGGSTPEPPIPGQNATTYNVTFGGFNNPYMNTTVNVASLPQTFTEIGGYNFYSWIVLSDNGNGIEFTGATVSGGDKKVSVNIPDWSEMTITVTGTFEGTATIHVEGYDPEIGDVSRDITVSCVAPPQPHTVRMAAGTEDAANWSLASGNASVPGTAVLENVMSGSQVTATYNGTTKKVKSVKAVKYVAPEVTTVTWNSTNVFNSDHWMDELSQWNTAPLTYEGITISMSGTGVSNFSPYDHSAEAGRLTCFGEDGDSYTFTAPDGKKFCKIEIIDNVGISFDEYGDWTLDVVNHKIVWSGTAANTVTLGSVDTFASHLNSIVFKLIDAQ